MKYLKNFTELNEGLIKTASIKEFIKLIETMVYNNGLSSIIHNAGGLLYGKDGHVRLTIDKGKNKNLKVLKFGRLIWNLMSVAGYYLALVYYEGNNMESDIDLDEPVKIKDDKETFLQFIQDTNSNRFIEGFQLCLEPRFENKAKVISKILYHITEKNYWKKISVNGLVPKSKSKIAYHPDRIYLATKFAMDQILPMYKSYIKDPIILKVNVKGLNLYEDINAGIGAYYTTENISPDRITLVKQNINDFITSYEDKNSTSIEKMSIKQRENLWKVLHDLNHPVAV